MDAPLIATPRPLKHAPTDPNCTLERGAVAGLTGPPMTLGNTRELGLHHRIGYCHNDACRHQALIDVSDCRQSRDQLVPAAGQVRQMR
jgi:hypothetical protein